MSKLHRNKIIVSIFILILFVLISLVSMWKGYDLGYATAQKDREWNLEANKQDLSIKMAEIKGKHYIKHLSTIYAVESKAMGIDLGASEATVDNPDNYSWRTLLVLDKPEDSLFDFQLMPVSKDIMFVVQSLPKTIPIQPGHEKEYYSNYLVFKYSNMNKEIRGYGTFSKPFTGGYYVPKIDRISQDERFISFNTYGCWGCGGHPASKVVMGLDNTNMTTKELGRLAEFEWLEDGKYKYKDLVTKPCTPEGRGICTVSSANQPFKFGSMSN